MGTVLEIGASFQCGDSKDIDASDLCSELQAVPR
jgi:hypothetical protein